MEHPRTQPQSSDTSLSCRLSTTEIKRPFFGFKNQYKMRKTKTKAEQKAVQYTQIANMKMDK